MNLFKNNWRALGCVIFEIITLKTFWDYVNECKKEIAFNTQFEKMRALLDSDDLFHDIKTTDCLKSLLKK